MVDYTSLTRAQWLGLAQRLFDRIEQACVRFTPSEWKHTTPYLGWRVRDVLAHMTGAMPVNFRQVLERALAGDPSAPPEFNTFGRNKREVKRRKHMPIVDLMQEFRSEFDAIMATYREISEHDWLKPAWFFVGTVNVRTIFLAQLGDNVLHERDLLLVNKKWKGLDPEYAGPLIDWLMRELRPAGFRPEKVAGLQVTALFRLSGAGGGQWTMAIAHGDCVVTPGEIASPHLVVEADTEDMFAAAQARAMPLIGRLARCVDWLRGPSRTEETVAFVTGYASLGLAKVRKRIRISGDQELFDRFNRCFWHFWERTKQTEENIGRGRL